MSSHTEKKPAFFIPFWGQISVLQSGNQCGIMCASPDSMPHSVLLSPRRAPSSSRCLVFFAGLCVVVKEQVGVTPQCPLDYAIGQVDLSTRCFELAHPLQLTFTVRIFVRNPHLVSPVVAIQQKRLMRCTNELCIVGIG